MRKITIKDIVAFRRKSDKSKLTFAEALKNRKEVIESESGGDYWITSLSAISRAYKSNDLQFITQKRSELENKYNSTDFDRTKNMYQRNIDILDAFEDYDFKKIKPPKLKKFLSKPKIDSILKIKGFPVQCNPHHVFEFGADDNLEIGAIWFIAQLRGFKNDELAMFTDILYRYLKKRFPKAQISARYCIAVDLLGDSNSNYSQLEKKEIPSMLNSTLDEIRTHI